MAGKTDIELPPLLSNNSTSNNSSTPRQSSLRSIYETVNEITSTGDRSPPNPNFTPEIQSPPVPENSGTLRGGQHQHYPAFSTSQLKHGADFEPWWRSANNSNNNNNGNNGSSSSSRQYLNTSGVTGSAWRRKKSIPRPPAMGDSFENHTGTDEEEVALLPPCRENRTANAIPPEAT